jgi:hypothetical protein
MYQHCMTDAMRGCSMRDQDKKETDYFLRSTVLLVIALLITSGCGYRLRSSAGKLPNGIQSIGIPTFRNLTTEYRVEQIISRAVLNEFSLRTRTPVNSSSSNVDAVLLGDIRGISSVPVTYGAQSTGSQTFGSAFLVTVAVSVKLKRIGDSKIIWQNDDFVYRERFVLNADVRDFFSEENPALERLSRSFAASLAAAILDRPKP